MKLTHMAGLTSIALISLVTGVAAQNRPAPTGQVPKAYSGQQGSVHSGYQPRPTGQIAPAVPGQSPASLPRPANTSQVQNLGFEHVSSGVTAEGQVPKVNSNQDPRTFPERYQSTTATPAEQTITIQREQMLPPQTGAPQTSQELTTQTSVTTQTNTTAPATQQNTTTQQTQANQPVQSTQPAPATNIQPAQQRSPSQISTQPQAPAPGAPKRMDP